MLDGGASCFLEIGNYLLEHAFLGACPGAGDGDNFTLQIRALVVRRQGWGDQGCQHQSRSSGHYGFLKHASLLLFTLRGPSAKKFCC